MDAEKKRKGMVPKLPELDNWKKMLLFFAISIVICIVKQYLSDYLFFISLMYIMAAVLFTYNIFKVDSEKINANKQKNKMNMIGLFGSILVVLFLNELYSREKLNRLIPGLANVDTAAIIGSILVVLLLYILVVVIVRILRERQPGEVKENGLTVNKTTRIELEDWQKMFLFIVISIVVCLAKRYLQDSMLFISLIYMIATALFAYFAFSKQVESAEKRKLSMAAFFCCLFVVFFLNDLYSREKLDVLIPEMATVETWRIIGCLCVLLGVYIMATVTVKAVRVKNLAPGDDSESEKKYEESLKNVGKILEIVAGIFLFLIFAVVTIAMFYTLYKKKIEISNIINALQVETIINVGIIVFLVLGIIISCIITVIWTVLSIIELCREFRTENKSYKEILKKPIISFVLTAIIIYAANKIEGLNLLSFLEKVTSEELIASILTVILFGTVCAVTYFVVYGAVDFVVKWDEKWKEIEGFWNKDGNRVKAILVNVADAIFTAFDIIVDSVLTLLKYVKFIPSFFGLLYDVVIGDDEEEDCVVSEEHNNSDNKKGDLIRASEKRENNDSEVQTDVDVKSTSVIETAEREKTMSSNTGGEVAATVIQSVEQLGDISESAQNNHKDGDAVGSVPKTENDSDSTQSLEGEDRAREKHSNETTEQIKARKDKSKKEIRIINIAAFALAIVSWMATAEGLHLYVFESEVQAGLVSFGIQAILLIANLCVPKKFAEIPGKAVEIVSKQFVYLKNAWFPVKIIAEIFYHLMKPVRVLCMCIITVGSYLLLVAPLIVLSSFFSYVYISDLVYSDTIYTDADAIMDKSYRTNLYKVEEYANEEKDRLLLQINELLTAIKRADTSPEMDDSEKRTIIAELNAKINAENSKYAGESNQELFKQITITTVSSENDLPLVLEQLFAHQDSLNGTVNRINNNTNAYTEAQSNHVTGIDTEGTGVGNYEDGNRYISQMITILETYQNKFVSSQAIIEDMLKELIKSNPDRVTLEIQMDDFMDKILSGDIGSSESAINVILYAQQVSVLMDKYFTLTDILADSSVDMGEMIVTEIEDETLNEGDATIGEAESDEDNSNETLGEGTEEDSSVVNEMESANTIAYLKYLLVSEDVYAPVPSDYKLSESKEKGEVEAETEEAESSVEESAVHETVENNTSKEQESESIIEKWFSGDQESVDEEALNNAIEEWKESWNRKLTALENVVKSVPSSSQSASDITNFQLESNTGNQNETEATLVGETVADEHESPDNETGISFDSETITNEITKLKRNYLSEVNVMEKSINYMLSEYRFLAVASLIFAVSMDLTALAAGFFTYGLENRKKKE